MDETLPESMRAVGGASGWRRDRDENGSVVYDAFISYSHAADGKLAPSLQHGLEHLAKPWYRMRALRVFRDQTDLAANPALWSTIQAALDASRYFILLASPPAAASPWVAREVEHCRLTKRSENLLIALTAGSSLAWDAGRSDFDWEQVDALPRALAGAFTEEPLWVDLRFAADPNELSLSHPGFREAVRSLAAPLHGLTPSELASEEARRHRRTVRAVAAVVVTLATLLAVSVFFFLDARSQRDAARAQTRLALSNALAVQSETDPLVDRAALLGLESCLMSCGPQARSALFDSLERSRGQGLVAYLRHGAAAEATAFRPDGRELASGQNDGTVVLWNVRTRAPIHVLDSRTPCPKTHSGGCTNAVLSVAFDPGGRILAAGTANDAIVEWSAVTGRRLRVLSGATNWVTAVAFSPDGKTLVSGSLDGSVTTWDAATGRRGGSPDLGDAVSGVAFSSTGRAFAASYGAKVAVVWNLAAGTRDDLDVPGGDAGQVAFSPDGRTLAAAGGSDVVLWREGGGAAPTRSLPCGTQMVNGVAFSADGKHLACGNRDGTVTLWNVAKLPTVRRLRVVRGHGDAVTGVAFSPDGALFASSSADSTVALWDVPRGSEAEKVPGAGRAVAAAVFTPDGQVVVSRSGDAITLTDVSTGRLRRVLHTPRKQELAAANLAVSPAGTLLAAAGQGAAVWSIATGKLLRVLDSRATLTGVAFSPDGRTLATAGFDTPVSLWSIASGRLVRSLPGSASPFDDVVAFSPDGRTLASLGPDSTIDLWGVASGKLVHRLSGHLSYVIALAFSPDGRELASGSADTTVVLWDVATGRPLHVLRGHRDYVTTVAFSPDGRSLISGSNDRTIGIWDVATGTRIADLPADGTIDAVAVSSSGRLASGEGDGLFLWTPLLPIEGTAALDGYVCGAVRRNLTRDEWQEYLPGQPYAKTCNGQPAGS